MNLIVGNGTEFEKTKNLSQQTILKNKTNIIFT